MPSHVVAIISSVVLTAAIAARVAQLFAKEPSLKGLAPTQSGPPFLIAQLTVLVRFVALTIVANRGFRGFGPVLSPR